MFVLRFCQSSSQQSLLLSSFRIRFINKRLEKTDFFLNLIKGNLNRYMKLEYIKTCFYFLISNYDKAI